MTAVETTANLTADFATELASWIAALVSPMWTSDQAYARMPIR